MPICHQRQSRGRLGLGGISGLPRALAALLLAGWSKDSEDGRCTRVTAGVRSVVRRKKRSGKRAELREQSSGYLDENRVEKG